MRKPKPIIAEQQSRDIHKLSDLIEVAGSKPGKAIWVIDGERYTWEKDNDFITLHALSGKEFYQLEAATKIAAKKRIFDLVK